MSELDPWYRRPWRTWWLIRHVRYAHHAKLFNDWWQSCGQHCWLAPNEVDIRFLDDIWDGKR